MQASDEPGPKRQLAAPLVPPARQRGGAAHAAHLRPPRAHELAPRREVCMQLAAAEARLGVVEEDVGSALPAQKELADGIQQVCASPTAERARGEF